VAERFYEPGLVTVAITTHNRSALMQRALAGALAQSYPKLEILVSDDASTDDTPQVMAQVRDPRVRYLRIDQPAKIAGNFQNALDHARGELFMILNDDDELEPEAIAGLARAFFEPPAGFTPQQIVLSWCRCKVQDQERRVRYITGAGPAVEPGIDLVVGLFDGTRGARFCGILVRTKNAVEVGYSREHGPIPDVGNWTRLCARGGWACCVNEPLARYTAHNASCTGTSPAKTWQHAGEVIVRDILADLQQLGDTEKQRRIRRGSRNFITGLLATILMQSAGRPGWSLRVLSEFLRAPQYFLTPMTARRLLLEGGKIFCKGTDAPT
jgi:glycosyltransferase involved in cell wall biosynthesis